MLSKAFRTALVALVGTAFLSAGGCGQSADSNTRKVGPAGPTTPGNYYFTLEVHPAAVQKSGTVVLSVRVANAADTAINGTVTAVTVNYSGSSTTAASVAINSTGRANTSYTITGAGGTVTYINANVEDKSLTIPIQILP